jgi:DNA helicase HerA-like ATPase
MAAAELGTVLANEDGPTTIVFSFVVSSPKVRKGQFVSVQTDEGLLIGTITELTRANRYFEVAESVSEYEKNASVALNFPTAEWEYTVANVRVHGIFSSGRIVRSTFPAQPGTKVLEAQDGVLKQFLGIDENGLEIGKLQHHEFPLRVSMSRLLQKHLAILAMSGSGKSHLAGVLMEELLSRPPAAGRIALLVMDNHGEYTYFKHGEYAGRTTIIDAAKIRVSLRRVSWQMLSEWMPHLSGVQKRELEIILAQLKGEMKEKHESYGLEELTGRIEATLADKKKDNIKGPLLSWLGELRRMKIIGKADFPKMEEVVKPGHLAVIDFSAIDSLRKKQILVAYFSRRLFKMRKKGKIPPFAMFVEEAHNFAPEKAARESAISRSPIETIAREGRKFQACVCLISQRPVHLSTTALSQCNTNIILRVTNPFDVDHIGKSCEGIDSSMLGSITTLRVGEALIVGEALNYPVFVSVRDRKSKGKAHSSSLEEAALKFESEQKKKKEDVEAFL